MNTIEFRYISEDDKKEIRYKDWSRIYEYPAVKDLIEDYGPSSPSIHNTSWGYEGCHVMFKDDIDSYGNLTHTDIRYSGDQHYDIRDKWIGNKFDVVISISTLEHLKLEDQWKAYDCLCDQLISGGLLVLTADVGHFDINGMEDRVGYKCSGKDDNRLRHKSGVSVIVLCQRKD